MLWLFRNAKAGDGNDGTGASERCFLCCFFFFFFQAEDGIRDLVRSRGLGMCIRDSSFINKINAIFFYILSHSSKVF